MHLKKKKKLHFNFIPTLKCFFIYFLNNEWTKSNKKIMMHNAGLWTVTSMEHYVLSNVVTVSYFSFWLQNLRKCKRFTGTPPKKKQHFREKGLRKNQSGDYSDRLLGSRKTHSVLGSILGSFR